MFINSAKLKLCLPPTNFVIRNNQKSMWTSLFHYLRTNSDKISLEMGTTVNISLRYFVSPLSITWWKSGSIQTSNDRLSYASATMKASKKLLYFVKKSLKVFSLRSKITMPVGNSCFCSSINRCFFAHSIAWSKHPSWMIMNEQNETKQSCTTRSQKRMILTRLKYSMA